ncbi:hypothetical protein [uncultured Clostridium sp.]|uniref:hypothetical protein n=1 Tax=uncultured Clostridium sp. TaxID=59620 RepID=UPI002634E210|nr:hypothetical protein [uncultured Clostridium sp.]
MSDINNKYLNTVSSKLKKISMLLKYTHKKISENQEIKRLVYYNTKNPLFKKGLKYDNSKIDQPDLSEEDVKNLITLLPFNPDMKMDLCNSIFLNIPSATFLNGNNVIYLDVNIISPIEYFEITTGLRPYEISYKIANIFDNLYVDSEDYIEELGNLQFILDDISVNRLSNSSNMIWCSMRFSIQLMPQIRIQGE